MSELGQGLTLSGIGILITFSALGILIVLILVLKALFPEKAGTAEKEESAGERQVLLKRAAGVGVAALRERRSSSQEKSLGKLLEDSPGRWWRKGLDRVHGRRSGDGSQR